MELLQGALTIGRQADLLDALANMLGAIVAGCCFRSVNHLSDRPRLALLAALLGCCCLAAAPPAAAAASVGQDAELFVSGLPSAAGTMASFPANGGSGGPWWTVTAAVALATSYSYDGNIRQHLQDARSPALNRAARAGSLVGDPLVHLGLVAGTYGIGYLAADDQWRMLALKTATALFLADSITLVAKEGIGRARPDSGRGKGSFRPFRFDGRSDSLPSLHTASSFALATVLAGETDNPYLITSYYLGATWVGVSRLLQDRHWASDVVLGAALGGLSGWAVRQQTSAAQQRASVVPLALTRGGGLALIGHW